MLWDALRCSEMLWDALRCWNQWLRMPFRRRNGLAEVEGDGWASEVDPNQWPMFWHLAFGFFFLSSSTFLIANFIHFQRFPTFKPNWLISALSCWLSDFLTFHFGLYQLETVHLGLLGGWGCANLRHLPHSVASSDCPVPRRWPISPFASMKSSVITEIMVMGRAGHGLPTAIYGVETRWKWIWMLQINGLSFSISCSCKTLANFGLWSGQFGNGASKSLSHAMDSVSFIQHGGMMRPARWKDFQIEFHQLNLISESN